MAGMGVSRRLGAIFLAAGVALASGCAQAPLGGASAAAPATPQDDVLRTVAAVKSAGAARTMSSRAIRLPARPLEPLTTFEYRYPPHCGSHAFRVIEAGETRILEYRLSRADTAVQIRDYVAGPHPFIRPGIWGAFDHTADDLGRMQSELVETSTPLLPAVYSRGLVTALDPLARDELQAAYAAAVRAAASCGER